MEKHLINEVSVETKQGNKGNYNVYRIKYDNDKTASTIKKELGEFLKTKTGQEVNVDIKPNERGYMEVVAVEGIEQAKKSSSRKGLSEEDIKRIEKRIQEKDFNIARSVALNNATLLCVEMYKHNKEIDPVSSIFLLADQLLEWLTNNKEKNGR